MKGGGKDVSTSTSTLEQDAIVARLPTASVHPYVEDVKRLPRTTAHRPTTRTSQMSDLELLNRLKNFRPNQGPIVDTTRPIYERLLDRLRREFEVMSERRRPPPQTEDFFDNFIFR